ncbi:MAG: Uma2 family endonuclease [Myxococcaceae bacterium]|nr:Uma2 family endonuclease [Myxococcaceae bacterium]
MASAVTQPRMSWKDFVAFERAASEKHEFLRGEVWAMAGGTPEHGRLAANVMRALGNTLQGRPCVVMSSDVRVRVRDTDRSTYPDAFVVCGRLEHDPDDENTITNPLIIVEVLSASTEASDRGEKFAHYQHLTSLRDYVLISQTERRIEVFSRGAGASWLMTPYGPGQRVPLPSVNVELDLDALYFNPLA